MSQQFLIAPFETGLETDEKPFLLPQEAFPRLNNLYIFRGRVVRKPGYYNLGRLRRVFTAQVVGVTAATPWTFNIFTVFTITEPNAQIQPGSVIITIVAGPNIVFTDQGDGTLTSPTAGNSGVINYVTGDVTLTHTAGTGVATTMGYAYYPGLPVMGLRSLELPAINQYKTIAFDTVYSYTFNAPGGWEEYLPGSGKTWSGSDSQLFWSTNYRGLTPNLQYFWVTNFNAADPIRYSDGSIWTDFSPLIDAANTLIQALCIISFKNRLVCFNTIETVGMAQKSYQQRARWSWNGDPTNVDAWRSDIKGQPVGGYTDATTSESITSVQFIKDRVIVYFEHSTWELVYTGNEILPFIFQRINTELGCTSTFSEVVFDDGLLAIGNVGIHSANTGGVQRIDTKIPDQIFNIKNLSNGPERVYGIRDFYKELVYWTYPFSSTSVNGFPDQVLCYNYRNNSFSTFDESFTCYGNFQRATNYTWATLPYDTWDTWNTPWNSAVTQAFFPQIVAGNQQGFTSLIDYSTSTGNTLYVSDIVANGATTSLITSPNHNLQPDMYIKLYTMNGITMSGQTSGTYKIYNNTVATPFTANTFTIDGLATGTYKGGGEIRVVYNIDLRTKNFMPFASQGKIANLDHVSFLFDRTADGEVTFNTYIRTDYDNFLPTLTGSNVVNTQPEAYDPYGANQDQMWHTYYINLISSSFQFQITLSDLQIRDDDIRNADFQMHALLFAASPTGRLRR